MYGDALQKTIQGMYVACPLIIRGLNRGHIIGDLGHIVWTVLRKAWDLAVLGF